jgi:transcriptional regulator with XRE-family HTH domain
MTESEQKRERRTALPIRDDESELVKRLRELIDDDSVSAFARRCGIGESVLRSYLAGAMPSADRLAAIAQVRGVTTDWLICGFEPKLRADIVRATGGLDRGRLQDAIAAVEEGLRVAQKRLSPDKHAELISLIYETEGPINRPFVVRMITFSPA